MMRLEIRQTILSRAIRANGISIDSILPLSYNLRLNSVAWGRRCPQPSTKESAEMATVQYQYYIICCYLILCYIVLCYIICYIAL